MELSRNQFIGYLSLNWKFLLGVFSIWLLGYFNFSIVWIIIGFVTYLYTRHVKNERKKELMLIRDFTNLSVTEIPAKYLPSWVSVFSTLFFITLVFMAYV